jgi:hypothetical protein
MNFGEFHFLGTSVNKDERSAEAATMPGSTLA